MDPKVKPETVTFKCRFKRFSTYLDSGKRVRFADGILRTADPDVIAFLRKNYRPPLMAEVKESVRAETVEPEAGSDNEQSPELSGPMAPLSAPPAAPSKKGK